LYNNGSGTYNTAVGEQAAQGNSSGHENVAVGAWAFRFGTGSDNTAVGADANSSLAGGNYNIAVGSASGTVNGTFNNTISIGNYGYWNSYDNQVFLGNLSTGWNGGNVGWSTYSDARVKRDVNEDVVGLDFINKLRPVTYHRDIDLQAQLTGNDPVEDYPRKYDIEKIKFSGFIAQEVEQAAIESGYEFSGVNTPKTENDLYTLTYESFVVPLVKAVQEQQIIIQTLTTKIAEMESEMEELKGRNQSVTNRK
jgi:trimeric autotransporter adhesin